MAKYEDCYAAAQFTSLAAVVTHALSPEEDRAAAYGEAGDAMVKDGRWRGYRMMFSPKLRMHVGYRYENPKDWFLLNTESEEVDGPFRSKKQILSKLHVKRSKSEGAGRYSVSPHWLLFTRDQAEVVGLDSEELPV